jgi:hypothetical protein
MGSTLERAGQPLEERRLWRFEDRGRKCDGRIAGHQGERLWRAVGGDVMPQIWRGSDNRHLPQRRIDRDRGRADDVAHNAPS